MFDKQKVLVVAAHPDDEVLGCGGTLARLAEVGSEITVLILGEGITSRQINYSPENVRKELENLKNNAAAAHKILGVYQTIMKSFPDNRFDRIDLLDIIKEIEDIKSKIDPELVFTHHSGDLNIDHEITHRAVMTAFRPLPTATPATIFAFEILSSTEYVTNSASRSIFLPDTYVSLSNKNINSKVESFKKYREEIKPAPHPRSIKGIKNLAGYRGYQVGRTYAEAFITLRKVIP